MGDNKNGSRWPDDCSGSWASQSLGLDSASCPSLRPFTGNCLSCTFIYTLPCKKCPMCSTPTPTTTVECHNCTLVYHVTCSHCDACGVNNPFYISSTPKPTPKPTHKPTPKPTHKPSTVSCPSCTFTYPVNDQKCGVCEAVNPTLKQSDDSLAKALEEMELVEYTRRNAEHDRLCKEQEEETRKLLEKERKQKQVIQYLICPVCTTRNLATRASCKTCNQSFDSASVYTSNNSPVSLTLGSQIYDQGGVLDTKLATGLGIKYPVGTGNKCMANAAMYLMNRGNNKDKRFASRVSKSIASNHRGMFENTLLESWFTGVKLPFNVLCGPLNSTYWHPVLPYNPSLKSYIIVHHNSHYTVYSTK